MLYKYLHSLALADHFTAFNVFRYITFRTFLSFLTAFGVSLYVGPLFIQYIKKLQWGQEVRDDGPQTHKKKQGTPTMGGAIILMSVLVPLLLWVDLASPLVLAVVFITTTFGIVGLVDDLSKVLKKNTKGIPGRLRLLLEFTFSGIAVFVLVKYYGLNTQVPFPLLKNVAPDIGWAYVPFAAFIIVGCANAVNLTDGLDGLAIAPVIICSATIGLMSYLVGHAELADYLKIIHVPNAGEMAPLAAAFVAAGLGFLWFNSYPAQVFMGDVGSLSLGGFIGTMAVLTKNELLLGLLGGVFVIEALSVITQVLSFKLTGKRVFRMAPIHHHFELKGVDEPKLIVRFWIASIILAVLSLSTLKLR